MRSYFRNARIIFFDHYIPEAITRIVPEGFEAMNSAKGEQQGWKRSFPR
jgi:hypothetical protein